MHEMKAKVSPNVLTSWMMMIKLLKLQKLENLLVFSWLEFGWNGEEKSEFEDDRKLERE